MAYSLQVVSSGLLDALMRRDRSVSGRSSQVFSVLVRDVFPLAVFVALCKTEVNDEDLVSSGL